MNLETLLSTKERIKILRHVIFETGPLSVNRVASEVKLSKGLVSKYFDSLAKEGVLKKSGSKLLVENGVPSKALRILLNLDIFDSTFFRKYSFVRSVGIYGSMAKGTNTEESDIDMWLLVEAADEERLAHLTSGMKKTFGDVKPLYLTKEKLRLLKKNDFVFYCSLMFGSITVYGEGIEEAL